MSIYTTSYENVDNLRATMKQAHTANELIDLYSANMDLIHQEMLDEFSKQLLRVQHTQASAPVITGFYSGFSEIRRMARTYLDRKLRIAKEPILFGPSRTMLHNGLILCPMSIHPSGMITFLRMATGEEEKYYVGMLDIDNFFMIVDLVGDVEMGVVNADTAHQ